MEYFFDNERPIYIQLVEQLKWEIIREELKPGEKIPSVRELALQAQVNPNTILKALAELERDGLIYTERTNGKFVTTDILRIEQLKKVIIEDKITNFIVEMDKIGLKKQDIIRYLRDIERKEQ